MDAAGLEVAAHPAGLDVDDRAGAEGDGVGRVARRRDALVQAERRAQQRGQLGVLAQVALLERLLDQQEVELVEPGQVAGVAQRVGAVGVDLEQHVRPDVGPHRATRSMSWPGSIFSLTRR